VFHGENTSVFNKIIRSGCKIEAIYSTIDYTPYAINRDAEIKDWCLAHGVQYYSSEDVLLHPLKKDYVLTQTGAPFKKFTPFFNEALRHKVSKPRKLLDKYWKNLTSLPEHVPFDFRSFSMHRNPRLAQHGGRKNAITALRGDGSLSAYNKFGCLSIREVYWFLHSRHSERTRGLYWRDFYYRIVWYFPNVLQLQQGCNRNFKPQYNKLQWSKNEAHFAKWCKGLTGFPIVDAGMRELNQTGNISNRMRLIVASFLVKDLHINWEEGERYFATKLIDYDPAQNNGNWQWVAGSGTDSQPYFRIFNPWNQSQKYDPDATYIKKWIPELLSIPPARIHRWFAQYNNSQYAKPIVDHDKEKKIAPKLAYSVVGKNN